jgi:hypothetical protein
MAPGFVTDSSARRAGEAHAWLRGYRAAQLEAMRDD